MRQWKRLARRKNGPRARTVGAEKKKAASWSTKKLEEVTSSRDVEDTEEMVQ